MVPLKGSFAKTHLMSFLQCLKAGNVYWNDSKQLMTCPAGQLQLAEHLKHGMFYEVFSWEGVTQDMAAIFVALPGRQLRQRLHPWGNRDAVVEEYPCQFAHHAATGGEELVGCH